MLNQKQFRNPPAKCHPGYFWSMGAPLDAEKLKAQLQEPEDSADYQYAKRFLDEALAAEADKDAPRRENEKRRAELEAEYNALLTERLNYEKYLAETRNRPRKEKTK